MTTWVLLRGLMRDKRHWNGFDQRLRQRGCTVFTPDLPGNGLLCHQKSPLSIEKYAQAVWQQLDENLQGQPFYLLGLSMGGMLAMEMAQQRPWQVKHGECKKICVSGILSMYLKGHKNASIRPAYRPVIS